jgi:hypothetical protein
MHIVSNVSRDTRLAERVGAGQEKHSLAVPPFAKDRFVALAQWKTGNKWPNCSVVSPDASLSANLLGLQHYFATSVVDSLRYCLGQTILKTSDLELLTSLAKAA